MEILNALISETDYDTALYSLQGGPGTSGNACVSELDSRPQTISYRLKILLIEILAVKSSVSVGSGWHSRVNKDILHNLTQWCPASLTINTEPYTFTIFLEALLVWRLS